MTEERWQELKRLLAEAVSIYAGRVDYGDLRMQVYDGGGDTESGSHRIAVAYETPGGSTNQFGISYEQNEFHMLDEGAEQEIRLTSPQEVVDAVVRQIESIPVSRLDRLRRDIDQMVQDGASRRQVLEELNRLLRLGTEFRGGSLTVEELAEACRYTVASFDPQGA